MDTPRRRHHNPRHRFDSQQDHLRKHERNVAIPLVQRQPDPVQRIQPVDQPAETKRARPVRAKQRPIRPSSQHCYPTERDRAIFAHIGRFGVASAGQLHHEFWAGRKQQTCLDRLNQLVRAGYLHTEMTTARGIPEPLFWIGRKASLLFELGDRRTFITGRPPAAEIAHLLRTADVVLALAHRYTLVSFTPERGLKREQAGRRGEANQSHVSNAPAGRAKSGQAAKTRTRQIADARVMLAPRPREGGEGEATTHLVTAEYAVEIDGQYYGKRLLAKAHDLGTSGQRVLWVVTTPRRFARIQRLARAYPTIVPWLFPDHVSPEGIGPRGEEAAGEGV